MKERKMRRAFAVLMAFIIAVAWSFQSVPAEAASLPSDVEKLERYAEQLQRTMQSRPLFKPYALYNKTKKSYGGAKQRIERLKNGPAKRQYRKRLEKASETIRQASYYISAIESGERLIALKSRIDQALSSGDVEVVYDVYPSFERQLRKTKTLIGRVHGSSIRKKMTETFQQPAEATKQRSFFPINIMFAFDQIIAAYEQDDIEKVERLLVLCEQWMLRVKDENTKKELNRYLDEFKTPAILDIQ
ncbi:hypothetical protein HNQ34_001321 [Anoxybacillus tepidamans]|uniref:SbsC C-terminal domain-containing protein n=1 Tax=Anoxybacteroides tepidamans TaxID=265948 RepID=A0A7W8IPH0_9BACL|nr:hypothetical protein [Anoxybacillus tepidamans]MBB5324228.1 hypothetical protein [Anoxybacillus tepidamans]